MTKQILTNSTSKELTNISDPIKSYIYIPPLLTSAGIVSLTTRLIIELMDMLFV